jgi:hypothetical protein
MAASAGALASVELQPIHQATLEVVGAVRAPAHEKINPRSAY